MIRLGQESIIDKLSFTHSFLRGAPHDEQYLRYVARGIKESDAPVTLGIDEVKGPGLHLPKCLVATPTSKRLRKFASLHFATPVNSNLYVGYYVIGGDAEPHPATVRGMLGVGNASQADVDNVVAIVETIYAYAVVRAVDQLEQLVQSGGEEGRGFLGVS